MINDLDDALERLLAQELGRIFTEAVSVVFDTPVEDFRPTTRTIDLFLYDVRENRELRSNDWLVERNDDGGVRKRRAPVRVDCSYLITAWAGDAKSEHNLLGEVMKILLRYPTLPATVLQGGSLGGQEPPLPTAVLQPGRLQSLGEFWQALGGEPKAALNYTVTIVVELGEPIELGPPVTDKRIPG
jgi:hypothetical protein